MKEQYQVDVYYLMSLGAITAGPFYSFHDARVAKNKLNPYSKDLNSGHRIVKTVIDVQSVE